MKCGTQQPLRWKLMKKQLLMGIFILIVFSFFARTQISYAATEEQKAIQAYTRLLKSKIKFECWESGEIVSLSKFKFTILYLDNNEVPELLLESPEKEFALMTYKTGKVIDVNLNSIVKENSIVYLRGMNFDAYAEKTGIFRVKWLEEGFEDDEEEDGWVPMDDADLHGEGYLKLVDGSVHWVCGRFPTENGRVYGTGSGIGDRKFDKLTASQYKAVIKNAVKSKKINKPKYYKCSMTNPSKVVATISIDKSSASLYVGETVTLKATVTGKSSRITWNSSKKSVATVNSKGKVTAKKAGKATITAKANGKKVTFSVSVKKSKIKINAVNLTLSIGEQEKLNATVIGRSQKIIWDSSNKSVATVDKKGTIQAKKVGKTTMTAKANGVTAKCTVFVKKVMGESGKILLFYSKVLSTPILANCKFALVDLDQNDILDLCCVMEVQDEIQYDIWFNGTQKQYSISEEMLEEQYGGLISDGNPQKIVFYSNTLKNRQKYLR